LCHHKSAESPNPENGKPLKSRPSSEPTAKEPSPLPGLARRPSSRDTRIHVSVGSPSSIVPDENSVKNARRKKSVDSYLKRRTEPDLSALEESAILDHKSFIQNVFGTVAFKMVEWLTPRNLERLKRSQGDTPDSPKKVSNGTSSPSTHPLAVDLTGKTRKDDILPQNRRRLSDKDQDLKSNNRSSGPEDLSKVSGPSPTPTKSAPPTKANIPGSKSTPDHVQSSALDNRHRRSYDLPGTRGILNKTSKLSESPTDVIPFPPQGFIPTPKQRLSRQSLITSPKMQVSEPPPVLHEIDLPVGSVTEPSDSTEQTEEESNKEDKTTQTSQSPKDESREEWSSTTKLRDDPLPQSLPNMSIDTMEFLCSILEHGFQAERHDLTPASIMQRHKTTLSVVYPKRVFIKSFQEIMRSDKQWHMFCEQVFFDVLSNPESLIKSFNAGSTELFDTQTMWYLMLRLTRTAPSLVLDSLWNAAGTKQDRRSM
jgi:hypothetical protein